MMDQRHHRQGGQSIVVVALALATLLIFVAVAVDGSRFYDMRRQAQNAADAATLAAVQMLGRHLNGEAITDADVARVMNDYAERNQIVDTDGIPGNAVNSNVIGCYLNNNKECMDHQPPAMSGYKVGGGAIPNHALGVEVVVYITEDTYFAGMLGIDAATIRAEAASLFEAACTGGDCVLPVAVNSNGFDVADFFAEGECYNMWDGAGVGNFGWVNWENQGYSCEDLGIPMDCWEGGVFDECCSECLSANLDPLYCERVDPTTAAVGDWVYGTTGVKNANLVEPLLKDYVLAGNILKAFVYDQVAGQGCVSPTNTDPLRYRIAGFIAFEMTGYRLSHGQGYKTCDLTIGGGLTCEGSTAPLVADPALCLDYPGVCLDPDGNPCDYETGDFNRITAIARPYADGDTGSCNAVGNLLWNTLVK